MDQEPLFSRKVSRVLPEKNKILVEGVNRVYKHMKPSQKNPQGGRLSKEMPINVSNVLLYNPSLRRGVRVGFRYNEKGQKERYCKISGPRRGGRPSAPSSRGPRPNLMSSLSGFPSEINRGPTGRPHEIDRPPRRTRPLRR